MTFKWSDVGVVVVVVLLSRSITRDDEREDCFNQWNLFLFNWYSCLPGMGSCSGGREWANVKNLFQVLGARFWCCWRFFSVIYFRCIWEFLWLPSSRWFLSGDLIKHILITFEHLKKFTHLMLDRAARPVNLGGISSHDWHAEDEEMKLSPWVWK